MNKYKQGDVREDGMVFWYYRNTCKNGEYWITPEKFNQYRKRKSVSGCKWAKNNRIKNRNNILRWKYGINQESYDSLLAYQNGGCAVCGTTVCPSRGTLSVDHCHSTMNVRGLLCSKCNKAIGLFNDNPSLLHKAASYLKSPPASFVLPCSSH
jgi:hypothetical protein